MAHALSGPTGRKAGDAFLRQLLLAAVVLSSLAATLVLHSRAYRLSLVDRFAGQDMTALLQEGAPIGEGPYLISNAARAGWGEMVYEGRRLYWFPYQDAYYRLHERQQIAIACLVLSTLGLAFVTTLSLLRRRKRQVLQ